MTVLDKALVFGGEQLEGVDETGVEELGGPEAGEEGGDVLLGGNPPNLDMLMLGQPGMHTGCIEDSRLEMWQPGAAADHND